MMMETEQTPEQRFITFTEMWMEDFKNKFENHNPPDLEFNTVKAVSERLIKSDEEFKAKLFKINKNIHPSREPDENELPVVDITEVHDFFTDRSELRNFFKQLNNENQ